MFGFTDRTTGDAVENWDVRERVESSVLELKSRLAEAKRFLRRLDSGKLRPGDLFLDFSGPLGHGYDRTGPSEVEFEK